MPESLPRAANSQCRRALVALPLGRVAVNKLDRCTTSVWVESAADERVDDVSARILDDVALQSQYVGVEAKEPEQDPEKDPEKGVGEESGE